MSIALAEYLIKRLEQLGIEHIFGVPGDFNLTLLDHVPEKKWIGCCNELNAAYAADGYARAKQAPSALITTYGVGELSAINGISGSNAEQVPVIHIVGMIARAVQDKKWAIHHSTIGKDGKTPDYFAYYRSGEPFYVQSEVLWEVKKAAKQIDEVLEQVYNKSLPGYICIPTDMVNVKVDGERLKTPLNIGPRNDEKVEDEVVSSILEKVYRAKNPIVLADVISSRYRADELVKELVNKTKIWGYTTILGKGIIDETNENFVGVYNGELSDDGVAEAVHASDCVINVGPLLTDSNTGGFTRSIKDENAVLLYPSHIQVGSKTYENIHFYPVFKKLVSQIDASKLQPKTAKPTVKLVHDRAVTETELSLAKIVSAVSDYIQPNDVVVTEVGTIQFCSADFKFKENNNHFSQIFYSSIGNALPVALGAALAGRRVILLEGDGSAQMSIQELGTMVRHNLDISIFLINNSGYSIERAIWGPDQKYNDICPNWNWTGLLKAFGGNDDNCVSTKVSTEADLKKVIKEYNDLKKTRLVEIILDSKNYPWRLEKQVQIMGKKNMDVIEAYSKANDQN